MSLSLALFYQQATPCFLPYLSIRGETMQMLEAFHCLFGHKAEFAIGVLPSGDEPPAAGIAMADQKSLGIFDGVADGALFQKREFDDFRCFGRSRRA